MPHVPDQPVLGRVEDIVQSDGEFHGAQVGGEVSAGSGHRLNQKLAQFLGQRRQARFGQLAQIRRMIDQFQEWEDRASSHG